MKQQVNFYKSEFVLQKPMFTANTMLAGVAVLATAMLLVYLYAGQQLVSIENERAIAAVQEQSALAQLEKLQPLINAHRGDRTWEQRLQEANDQLANKERVLNAVRGTRFGDSRGFSRHLRSLARSDIDGVWLTQIRLSASGDDTRLEGRAKIAQQVPAYLQFLAAELPFATQRFHHFQIDGVDSQTEGNVRFSVTSDAALAAQLEQAQ